MVRFLIPLLAFSAALGAAYYPEAPGFEHTGFTHDPELTELSGLAPSRRFEGVYWGHNDSGNAAELFAIKPDGSIVTRVRLTGASNIDWEDIASYELDGKPYLAIADIGDNFSIQTEARIIILPEPPLDATDAAAERVLHFRYADGARDAEALAVDLPARQFLIMDKGRRPAGLYALPFAGAEKAARIADVPETFAAKPALVAPLMSQYRGAITGMDLTPDGQRLLIVTNRDVLYLRRDASETWPQTLKRPWAAVAPTPRVGGIEAICWDRAGQQALIGNEGDWIHWYHWKPP